MVKGDIIPSGSNREETTLSNSLCENSSSGLSFNRPTAKLFDSIFHLIPESKFPFLRCFHITLLKLTPLFNLFTTCCLGLSDFGYH